MTLSGALQDVLAGEHAAVYAYAVVGGVVDSGGVAAGSALEAYEVHRARRDRAEAEVRVLGADPVSAEPGYALGGPVTASGGVDRLARQVEDRCAVLYAALVAAATDDLRREAAGWLEDAATRALAWGAPPAALPGVGPV
jgi:hypothetical protein